MDASGAFGVADESEVGIFAFTCHDFIPIGGVIKEAPEDFRVWEIRRDGCVVRPTSTVEVPTKGRRWAGCGGEFVDPDDTTGDNEECADWVAPIQPHDDEMRARQLLTNPPTDSSSGQPEGAILPGAAGSKEEEPAFLKFVLWKRCIDTLEALGALANALNVKVAFVGFAGIKDSVAVTCQEVTIPRWLGAGARDVEDEPNVTEMLVRKAADEVGEHLRVGNFSFTDKGLWPGQLTGNRFRICIRRATFLPPSSPSRSFELGSPNSEKIFSNSERGFPTCACGGGSCGSSCGRKRRVAADCTRSPDLPPRPPRCCAQGAQFALRHALRRIADRGFVNYIGMQRFGKGGVRSDLVGLAYLQQDYEKCIDLILFGPPEGGTRGSARSAGQKRTWRPPPPAWAETFRRTWSADSALRAMPKAGKGNYWIERRLLVSLKTLQRRVAQRGPDARASEEDSWYNQCRRAFLALPFAMRKLYTFAYLDRLWNICASERVAKSPNKAILGDLVWSDKARREVRRLETKEEVEATSIFDVLLPRPGRAIMLPGNFVGDLMKQYLRYDLDGNLENLAIDIVPRETETHSEPTKRQKNADPNIEVDVDVNGDDDGELMEDDENLDADGREEVEGGEVQGDEDDDEGDWDCHRWKINGDYRPLLCQPANLRWAVGPDHNQTELHQADHENRRKRRTIEEGLYRVTLSFDLPRGTYATMFLRELCFPRNLRLSKDEQAVPVGAGKRPKPAENAGSSGSRLVWSSDEEDEQEAKDASTPASALAGAAQKMRATAVAAVEANVVKGTATSVVALDDGELGTKAEKHKKHVGPKRRRRT